jgi:UDPglucose 6-dehydrogenase
MAAVENADALVIVTEWTAFKSPDFTALKQLLKAPLVFDGRNLYEPAAIADLGIEYYSIGRPQAPEASAQPRVVHVLQAV